METKSSFGQHHHSNYCRQESSIEAKTNGKHHEKWSIYRVSKHLHIIYLLTTKGKTKTSLSAEIWQAPQQ